MAFRSRVRRDFGGDPDLDLLIVVETIDQQGIVICDAGSEG